MKRIGLSLTLFCALPLLGGCNESVKPLFEGSAVAGTSTTVVISDLHLGASADFAEDTANRPCLLEFLKRAKVTSSLGELVIAGDLFDGWYLPFSYGPFKDYLALYQQVAKNNQDIVDAINAIIKEGRIKVVYVPGNHDVDFSANIVDSIFPGIRQSRDADGLGAYRTGIRNEIVIEHGHRYNAFCAPDPLTDADLKQGKVLFGPGYFFTRIAATSLLNGHNPRSYAFPDFGMTEEELKNASAEIQNAHVLYAVWNGATSTIGVPGLDFTSKIIPCGIAGFADYYALSDLVPLYRNGKLTNTLFKGYDSNWDLISTINKVQDKQSFAAAVAEAAKLPATDAKAYTQYFDVDETIDVVVFGHTHAPMIVKEKAGYAGKIYANSGTWIDHNIDGDNSTRTFVKVVSSSNSDEVSLYSYEINGTLTKKA